MKGSGNNGEKWKYQNEGIKKERIEIKKWKWRDQERSVENEGIKMKWSRKKG